NTTPRLSRWLIILSQYDYEIFFSSGIKHTGPDSLSRTSCQEPTQADLDDLELPEIGLLQTNDDFEWNAPIELINILSVSDLAEEQANDPYCKQILEDLSGEASASIGQRKLLARFSIDTDTKILYYNKYDFCTLINNKHIYLS